MTEAQREIISLLQQIKDAAGGGGAVDWGAITGTLSNQTDLATALSGKTAFLDTAGAPDNGVGANGDYAFDDATKTIYGPKAAGVWPAGVVLGGGGKSMLGSLGASAATSVAASTTMYTSVFTANYGNGGPNWFNAVEATRQFVFPYACTLRNLFVLTGTVQPALGSLVVTVRKNGADTALTLTVPVDAAIGVFSDITHSVAFAAGDLLSLKCVNNDTVSDSAQIISFSLEATNDL